MPIKTLGSLFGNDKLKLRLEETAQLLANAGADAFPLVDVSRQMKDARVLLFDQPFDLDGKVSAGVGLLGAGEIDDPFGSGQRVSLRPGFNVAELKVDANFELSGEVAEPGSGLSISARASSSGDVSYRHLLPVVETKSRINAFGLLVGHSALPQQLGLTHNDIDLGEVFRLEATLGLEFGLDFKAGYDLRDELTLELFDGLSTPFKMEGSATLGAALGLSLYEEMYLAVGRANQINDKWIRIRLQRVRERKLSFGASVALQVGYDLGSGLVSILEKATDESPALRAIDSLRQLKILNDAAEGRWSDVQGEISERLGDTLMELLDSETHWREWVADSPEVTRLVALSNEVVNTWDTLPGRLRDLWERLLGQADLGPNSEARRIL
ncbi:MAG: hypothetical protein AAGD06_15180, partial [Acidobacteriota bacterium]